MDVTSTAGRSADPPPHTHTHDANVPFGRDHGIDGVGVRCGHFGSAITRARAPSPVSESGVRPTLRAPTGESGAVHGSGRGSASAMADTAGLRTLVVFWRAKEGPYLSDERYPIAWPD
jgi:hypothetical protein